MRSGPCVRKGTTVGQPQKLIVFEHSTVDVAQDGAGRVTALGLYEVGYFLGLLWITSGMNVDGGAGFLLRENGSPHDAALEVGPRRLAADLTDDSRANVRTPRASKNLACHLRREVLFFAAMIALILILLDIVPASHDHVDTGTLRNFAKRFRRGA